PPLSGDAPSCRQAAPRRLAPRRPMTHSPRSRGFRESVMRLSFLAAGLLFAGGAHAAEPLDFSGSVRARYEGLADGARAGAPGSEAVWSLRSQLKAEYDAGPVSVVGEVFDSRAYGTDP